MAKQLYFVPGAQSERANFTFAVMGQPDSPWIKFIPRGKEYKGQTFESIKGSFGFELRKGTTYAEAEQLMILLSEHVDYLFYNKLPRHRTASFDPVRRKRHIALFVTDRVRKGVPETIAKKLAVAAFKVSPSTLRDAVNEQKRRPLSPPPPPPPRERQPLALTEEELAALQATLLAQLSD